MLEENTEKKVNICDSILDVEQLQPAFAENNVALLFTASDNYIPYLSTMLQSVIENSSKQYNYDIIVFHQNISYASKKVLQAQCNRENISIRFYTVTESILQHQNLEIASYYSVETYFRLLAPYILRNYNKILYLDSDMIVQQDVADLFNTILSDEYLLAACKDIEWITESMHSSSRRHYTSSILKLKNIENYFQAGILIFNLKIFRQIFSVEYIMELIKKDTWELLDQDILNHIAQDKVLFLNPKWNILTEWRIQKRAKRIEKFAPKALLEDYLQVKDKPSIIHYAGRNKVWYHNTIDFAEIWWKYAEHTPYSAFLQQNLIDYTTNYKKLKNRCKRAAKKMAMPFVNLLYPKGSARREKLRRQHKGGTASSKYSPILEQLHVQYTIEEQPTSILPAYNGENTVALLFAASDNYMPYFSTMLQSILENSSKEYNYDILVFHKNITKESEEKIINQCSTYSNITIRFYNVTNVMGEYAKLYLTGYFTIETYYRLLAPYILQEYDKILYLDSDMVVEHDVADLYNTSLTDEYLLAAAADADAAVVYVRYKAQKEYVHTILQLDATTTYFQAGTILFNLKAFRQTFTKEYIMEFAKSQTWQYLDQDILNSLAKDRVLFIDVNWNVMVDYANQRVKNIKKYAPKEQATAYMQARENPYVVHYAGPIKPWNEKNSDFTEIWWKYAAHTPYRAVLEQNRSQYEKEQKKLKNKCKRAAKKCLMPFVNLFFPVGSKRRQKLKKKFYKK